MDISTVIPVYNNELTINELYVGLTDVFEKLGKSYELIFINDGSNDNSWKVIATLQKKDPHIKAIDFRRHYGESAALQAGFDLAKGDYILTINATLENSPSELEKLYEKVKDENYDMVIGVRRGRFDGRWFSRIVSKLAHIAINFVSKEKFSDATSPIRALEREVVQNIKLFGDAYMYLPVLATLYGANFAEVEIKHLKPKHNSATLKRLNIIKFVFDMTFLKFYVSAVTPPFNLTPVRLFGGIGSVSALLGILGGGYLTYQKIVFGYDIGTRPLLLLSVLMLILGAIFLIFGILGEIIIRSYFESQNKLTYTKRSELVT